MKEGEQIKKSQVFVDVKNDICFEIELCMRGR